MKPVKTSIACAVVLAFCFAGHAISQPQQSEKDSADRLFQAGKFGEAGKLYSKMVAQNPKDHSAILQLGRIALFSNRLDEAQKWLEKAISLQSNDTDAKVTLAEVFYLRDDFQKAAAGLKGVDVSSNKLIIEQYPALNVAMLESFKGQTPYELQGNGESTHVKFVKTNPLPIVNVRVNGGKEFTFFIDTGARSSRSTRTLPRSLASRNLERCKAPFPEGSTRKSNSGALRHSRSAIGRSRICPLRCFRYANFRKDLA
jgi:tetratricopeptide (TPR) repeat protein